MVSSVDKARETLQSEQDLSLQIEKLNEAAIRRGLELASLQLEIDTMRQSEKATEDRMAVFYQDVQKFQQENHAQPLLHAKPDDPSGSTAIHSQQQQLVQQVEKYERMLRIMNNQIMLVRSSSDDLVKSLKDKLADSMNDKVQSDLTHFKQVKTLEAEKRELVTSLPRTSNDDTSRRKSKIDDAMRSTGSNHETSSLTRNGNPSQPPQPPRRHKSKEDDDCASAGTIILLKEDLKRLRTENQQLKQVAVAAATGEVKSNHGEGGEGNVSLRHTIQQLTIQNKRLESELSSAPQRPRRHKSIDGDVDLGTIDLLQEDLVRLRSENEQLKLSLGHGPACETNLKQNDILDSLNSSIQRLMIENKHLETELNDQRIRGKESLIKWTAEKANLQNDMDSMQSLCSFSQTETQRMIERNLEQATEQLDRIALLWDRADESIQGLESSINQIRLWATSNTSQSHEAEQEVNSVQEMATLVHGQIKISLMLIELKLRNNLTCLHFDSAVTSDENPYQSEGNDIDCIMKKIQSGAMDALWELESIAGEQVESLRSKFLEQPGARDAVNRQETLGDDFSSQFQDSGDFRMEQPTSIDMLISHEALETLQNEVLQVVERVKDKNETIDRLNAQIEEHKVRERTLMEELKRHMQDQTDRQLEEQQRLMLQQSMDHDNSEDVDGGSFDDGSSEYEEKTVDEAFFSEEVTSYDEETVL